MRRSPADALELAERRPEPAGLWIRYRPKRWPSAAGDWLELAEARLGRRSQGEPGRVLARPPDDLLYLPPVEEPARAWRDRIAAEAEAGGISPLVQLRLEEPAAAAGILVHDPLEALLAGELERLGRIAAGGLVVWPLLPGLTDSEELWEEGCGRLAAAAVDAVLPVAVKLAPPERRQLVERFPDRAGLFASLFHRPPPLERDFARCANRFGLEPLFERPRDARPGRRAGNRELAGLLLAVAELWDRLERSPAMAQELFAAGRFIDSSSLDVGALAREGNLSPLPWADGPARPLVEEWVATGQSRLWDELRSDYLEGTRGPLDRAAPT